MRSSSIPLLVLAILSFCSGCSGEDPTAPLASDRSLTAFGFAAADNDALDADVDAVIVGTAIEAVVPEGTDVTALVAGFTTTGRAVRVGATAQISGVTANDFSSPVTYTVVAADASTRDYTVTVREASSAAKEITEFGFLAADNDALDADATGTLAGDAIAIVVPLGTDRSALVATFATTGRTVRVGSVEQVSGVTANDFSSPVVYTVEAEDATTRDYTVTVGEAASTIWLGDHTINDADDMAAFAGYATITGTLEVRSDLAALDGLSSLTTVGGDLEIVDNDLITDLSGFDGLVSVGGAVVVSHNDLLASLDGLGALAAVGDELRITSNPALTTLAHLTSLTSLTSLLIGSDYYGGNAGLTTIDMPALASVGVLSVENNLGLADLTGLTALAEIGDLHLYLNPALTTLGCGAEAATPTVVTGSVEVFRNGLLEDLAGIDATTALSGWVRIVDNASLASLAAFDGLVTLGGYLQIGATEYGGHPALPDLGFGALTTIGGYLAVEDNDDAALTSLVFGSLQAVGGEVSVWGNASLRDVAGLGDLTLVPGNLLFGENAALTDLSALAGLTTVEGSLVVDTSGALETLLGLDDLATVQGNVEIRGNAALAHLDNLGSLTTVGGNLEIDRNAALRDVDGLAGVTALGGNGRLMVTSNTQLEHIDGLRNLRTVGGQVWINSNRIASLDLSSLQDAPRDLRIQGNTLLTTIDLRALGSIGTDLLIDNTGTLSSVRCDALAWIGRHVHVRNTSGLADLSFLAGFAAASDALNGDLGLENNLGLNDIDVLGGFTSLGGNLDITNNDGLTSLDALAGFTSVPGSVWVRDNDQIPDLGGLANVASIDGLLMIDDNPSLTALGLDALAGLTWDLYVRDNANLCADRATELQAQLEGHGWARTAYLSGNTGACP